jgi:Mrp family chromosome partitioning ATPase
VIGAGVYDIVFSAPCSDGSTVNAKEVARRVLAPASYAEAEGLLTSGVKIPYRKTSIVKGRGQEQVDDVSVRVEPAKAECAAIKVDGETEKKILGEGGNKSFGYWESPDSKMPEYDQWDQEPECQPGNLFFQRRQDSKSGAAFQALKVAEDRDLCYLPHQLIAVWSPDGWAKSFTAINLAALTAAKGFDTALVNYDLSCPELDAWFGVKQTGIGGFSEDSAGVLTFGANFEPEIVARFLKKRAWGIRYLPAGNKLGNIGTPVIGMEAMEQTLKLIYHRNTGGKPAITIVDAGRGYEQASTMSALRQAGIVLIPTDGSRAIAEVTKQQIEELKRLGYSPRFIELLFSTSRRKCSHVCQEQCSIAFDWMTFLIEQTDMRPQCLRVDGRRTWDGVFKRLASIGDGITFRMP